MRFCRKAWTGHCRERCGTRRPARRGTSQRDLMDRCEEAPPPPSNMPADGADRRPCRRRRVHRTEASTGASVAPPRQGDGLNRFRMLPCRPHSSSRISDARFDCPSRTRSGAILPRLHLHPTMGNRAAGGEQGRSRLPGRQGTLHFSRATPTGIL